MILLSGLQRTCSFSNCCLALSFGTVLTMTILFYRRGFLPKSLGQWCTHSSAQLHLTEHHKQRAMKMDPYATANNILRIANVPGVTGLAANSSGFTCHMLNYNRA